MSRFCFKSKRVILLVVHEVDMLTMDQVLRSIEME